MAALLLITLVVGCSSAPEVVVPLQPEKRLKSSFSQQSKGNEGRLLGTLTADTSVLALAGVSTLKGAQAQAFDQDGKPLAAPVAIDANGHFVMTALKQSRARIFVEADVNGLRFRAVADAPRERRDYGVQLDVGTTFLTDKLRRSMLDNEIFLEKVAPEKLAQAEEIVNIYMDQTDRRQALQEVDRDLNAFAFDHFMDEHRPVKIAMYQISPSILRGWTPITPIAVLTTPRPIPVPTLEPEDVATDTPTEDPEATGAK